MLSWHNSSRETNSDVYQSSRALFGAVFRCTCDWSSSRWRLCWHDATHSQTSPQGHATSSHRNIACNYQCHKLNLNINIQLWDSEWPLFIEPLLFVQQPRNTIGQLSPVCMHSTSPPVSGGPGKKPGFFNINIVIFIFQKLFQYLRWLPSWSVTKASFRSLARTFGANYMSSQIQIKLASSSFLQTDKHIHLASFFH